MGGAPSFKPFNFTFPFFSITTTTLTLLILIAAADSREDPPPIPSLEDDNGATTTSPPDVSAGNSSKKSEHFRPSTAVTMGILITTFSLTFLLLLYIKHCNGGNIFTAADPSSQGAQPSHERKNSGVDRDVVESLPIFRFGSLNGQRHGLDCAVCLTRFEDPEVLRLLPKCKHAFHVECVDTWLDAHSTCPLCRHKVDLEDIVQVGDRKVIPQPPPLPPQQQSQEEEEEEAALDIESGRNSSSSSNNNNAKKSKNLSFRRVSGRHSSEGERDDGYLQIVSKKPNEPGTSSFRGSVDSASASRKTKGGSARSRKDGTLLARDVERTSAEHRLEHRIIISPGGPYQQNEQRNRRWSDAQPSDLLYLTSEKIIRDGCSSRSLNRRGGRTVRENGGGDGGGMVNLRSVSEMTGMSRFMRGNNRERGGGEEREGVVTRWLGWFSKSQRR